MENQLSSAMRKLQASISPAREDEQGWMQQRFLFDPVPWQRDDSKHHQQRSRLQQIQQAVWHDQVLSIDLQMFPQGELNDFEIEPYSLVSKDHHWYVIGRRNGNIQPYLLEEILAVRSLEKTFKRDSSFDLQSFWTQWLALRQAARGQYSVTIQVSDKDWMVISRYLSQFVVETGCVDQGKNRTVRLNFMNLPEARGHLLALGGAVKILNPEPLRLSVQDFALQITAGYCA
jgi:predicted DNA-binding transcriptional regulator YafY